MNLIFVPGFINSLQEYASILEMAPKELHIYGLHQLGRDGSLPGNELYGYKEQYQHLFAQIDRNQKYFVFGDSMGATFATQLASENPFVQGLIIGDYIPRYHKLTQNWVTQIKSFEDIAMSGEMIEAIARDSAEIYFDETLGRLQCPIMLLKGEKSNLSIEKLPKNPHMQIKIVVGAGHDIFEPDTSKLWQMVLDFIRENNK